MADKSGKDPNWLFNDVLQVLSSNINAEKGMKRDAIEKGILLSLDIRLNT